LGTKGFTTQYHTRWPLHWRNHR